MKRALLSAGLFLLLLPLLVGRSEQGHAIGPNDDIKLVVLFAAGWNSNGTGGVDEPRSWNNAWGDAVFKLASLDKESVRIVRFSYKPATAAGAQDRNYRSCDANQSLEVSSLLLSRQMQSLTKTYPNARFMLVGHSLGGVVMTYWAATERDDKLLRRVEQVTTIDSPVGGVSWAELQSSWAYWLRLAGKPLQADVLDLVRELIAGRTCSNEENQFLPHLDATKGSDALRRLEGAGQKLSAVGATLYHLVNESDPFIFRWTQQTSNGITIPYVSIPDGEGGCVPQLNVGLVFESPITVTGIANCFVALHEALLHDERSLQWITDSAARILEETGGPPGVTFRMPYDLGETGINYSGGPHALGKSEYCPAPLKDVSGIDFANGPVGFEVLAVAAGTFLGDFETNESGLQPGYGVVIQVGDLRVGYWHLDKAKTLDMITKQGLDDGDLIPQGYPLGWAGKSGKQTSVHLHLELRRGTEPGSSPYAGTPVSWHDRSIDGWTIGAHRDANDDALSYQGSAVWPPLREKDIGITLPARAVGCSATAPTEVVAEVSSSFGGDHEVNLADKKRIDEDTAFAAIGGDGVMLPSTNCRRLTEEEGCSGHDADVGYARTATTLVVDVSPSMNDEGKLNSMKSAANSMLDFVQQENNAGGTNVVGVTAFSENAVVVSALTSSVVTLKPKISALTTSSATNIYAGLREGLSSFSGVPDDAKKILILMTDGMDTSGRRQADYDALLATAKDNKVCIYTVGFGSDVAADFLKGLADGSGCGQYAFADTSAGGFELRAEYLRARHQSTGAVLLDSAGQLGQGETKQLASIDVGRGSGELLATLSWPGSRAELTLTDPSGKVVDSNYPEASVLQTETDVVVIVQVPAPGTWQVSVTGVDVPERVMPFTAIVSVRELPASAEIETGDARDWWRLAAGAGIGLGIFGLLLTSLLVVRRRRNGPFLTNSATGKSVRMGKRRPTTIGSAPQNRIVVGGDDAWANHARIAKTDGGFVIEDRGTMSGTFVGGTAVRSAVLRDGDDIRIGDSTFLFSQRKPPRR